MSHPLLDPAKGPSLFYGFIGTPQTNACAKIAEYLGFSASMPQAEIVGVKSVDTIEFTIELRDLFQIGLSIEDIARKLLSRYVIQERVRK